MFSLLIGFLKSEIDGLFNIKNAENIMEAARSDLDPVI